MSNFSSEYNTDLTGVVVPSQIRGTTLHTAGISVRTTISGFTSSSTILGYFGCSVNVFNASGIDFINIIFNSPRSEANGVWIGRSLVSNTNTFLSLFPDYPSPFNVTGIIKVSGLITELNYFPINLLVISSQGTVSDIYTTIIFP